jgi:hypothetical protein
MDLLDVPIVSVAVPNILRDLTHATAGRGLRRRYQRPEEQPMTTTPERDVTPRPRSWPTYTAAPSMSAFMAEVAAYD